MTNEEAIMILKAMIDEMILVFDRDRKKALNMAIEALKAQLSNTSEIPNGSDLISRQDAITAIIGLPTWYYDSDRHYGDPQPPMEALLDPEDVVSAIENLPFEQPERKKGKWIEVDDPDNRISGRCSICDWEALLYETDVVGMDYCPNCGADMRGESDGD